MRMHLHGLQTALRLICFIAFSALWSLSSAAEPPLWIDHNAAGERQVHLYFFWSTTCPHCQVARPFVEALPAQHPWLVLHSREINSEPAASDAYLALAKAVGENASSVPAFIYCGKMEVGFDHAETSGRALEASLRICHESTDANTGDAAPLAPLAAINLPILGQMTPDQLSLPVVTLVIAGLDAFNPCAFFVLLFLLSLLVHAGSRGRMLFIGGVFLFFSGLIYFLFMAAWLNVFQWLGEIALVTTVAGWLAVIVALINIKDYFWFKRGVSLSIPDAAKPGFYQRVRGLLRADSLPAMTLGTIALAVAANSYELLCTAGFPMIYTRLLTLAHLSTAQYYAYLAFYNLVYVIPLLVITLVFTLTLGARKMSETEGRVLKLVSGIMMLGLGSVLLAAPAALNDLRVALLLLSGALGLSWLIHRLMKQG